MATTGGTPPRDAFGRFVKRPKARSGSGTEAKDVADSASRHSRPRHGELNRSTHG